MMQERFSPACSALRRRSARSMLPFYHRQPPQPAYRPSVPTPGWYHAQNLGSGRCRDGLHYGFRGNGEWPAGPRTRPVRQSLAACRRRRNRSVLPASRELGDHLMVAFRLFRRAERVQLGKLWPVIGIISAAALSFMVQDPSGIIA